jgi:hypothetical protein
MDPIAVILAALQAGALFVGEKVAGEAVKDSYTALKNLLIGRVKSNEEKTALIPAENVASDVWRARATQILERIDAKNDRDLIGAAQRLLTQVNQTQSSSGKFNLQANTIRTVVQGDYASIVFQNPDKKTEGE